ncbi:glycosyltransferase [Salipiger sp. IMCC34102]|nr:glycosyltransferase [Salipiger sp. IMCC34102]
MRVVDFLVGSDRLQAQACHVTRQVARGGLKPERLKADMIVSHLTLNWRGLPGLAALRAANPGTPMIHVEHSYTAGFVAHNVARPGRFFTMLKLGFAVFDRIVAVSEAQAEWFERMDLCRAAKIKAIPSCVDLSTFRALPARSGPVRVFGAIGRLEPQKGFDTLITAFRGLPDPDIALHIYGQGQEESALRNLAGDDTRIHFKGFAKTPTTAFASVDAVVMPSRWEAYGLVAIEALAAGLPVICANVDGMMDHAACGATVLPFGSATEARQALDRGLVPKTPRPSKARQGDALEEAFFSSWGDLTARHCALAV